jgi:hypothetical protein
MRSQLTIFAIVMVTLMSILSAQTSERPELVDKFSMESNDGLLTRVDNFQVHLHGSNAKGFVILSGSFSVAKYIIQRRMEGCLIMRGYSVDSLKFVFNNDDKYSMDVEFWTVPKGLESGKFVPTIPDYKLTDLTEPIELSVSMATDDFCPRHFDLEWYSRFMTANPAFRGKAVIDSSPSEFVRRASKYRNELKKLGVSSSRVRFIRRHFPHERDEQWWLIPPMKK